MQQTRAGATGDAATITRAFGAAWDVRLGREDSSVADPAGRLPAPGASVEEVRAFLFDLASKKETGAFAAKPPFWERPAFVVYPATTDSPSVRPLPLPALACLA